MFFSYSIFFPPKFPSIYVLLLSLSPPIGWGANSNLFGSYEMLNHRN